MSRLKRPWLLGFAGFLSALFSLCGSALSRAAPGIEAACHGGAGGPPGSAGTAVYRPAGGMVSFEMAGFLHSIKGRAPTFDGEFWVARDRGELVGGWFGIDAVALTTDDEDQDRLMRERYLEVERYPVICFVPSQIRIDGSPGTRAEGYTVTAQGLLRLHGQDRPLSLSARVTWAGEEIRIVGEKRLLLADYGIPTPRFLFFRTSEWVDVRFELVAHPLQVPAPITPLRFGGTEP